MLSRYHFQISFYLVIGFILFDYRINNVFNDLQNMYAQLLPLALPAPPMPGMGGGYAPPPSQPPMGGMGMPGMPPMPPFGLPPMGY